MLQTVFIILLCFGSVMPLTAPLSPMAFAASFDSDSNALSAATEFQPLVIEDSTPLTLERCIDIAIQNNPELAAISWEVNGSEYRLKQARAARLPTVSVEAGYGHYLDPQRLVQARYNGEPGYFERDMMKGDVVLKIPLYTGGKIINEIQASELLVQSEQNRLARSRSELIFNVKSLFFAMMGQQKVIESLMFSQTTMELNRNRIAALLAEQKAARVELLRIDVRLADLKQSMVREQNNLTIQKRVLANLMGLADDRFDVLGSLSVTDLNIDPVLAIQTALSNRKDFQSTKDRLQALQKRVDGARAGTLPTVSVLGSYGLRSDMTGDQEDVGAIGIGLSIPVFEGGYTAARVNEALTAVQAARERLRKLELQIRQEVDTSVLDIQASLERIRAVEKAINQAKESLRIEQEKYDLGAGVLIDILDAQTALLQSETSYYRAMTELHIAKARLDLATGDNGQ